MKVTAADSVIGVPPSVTTMVGAIAGADGVPVRLVTFAEAVELVNNKVAPEGAPVLQAAEVPVVKDPPWRLPKILVAERLLIT